VTTNIGATSRLQLLEKTQQWQGLPMSPLGDGWSHEQAQPLLCQSTIDQVSPSIDILYLPAPGLALVGGNITGRGSAPGTSPAASSRGTRPKRLQPSRQPKLQLPYTFPPAQFVAT